MRPLPARAKRCRRYVVTSRPRWFNCVQARLADIAGHNQPAGPDRVTPVFGCVVAPDDDTQYAAGFFDLSAEPIVLTIPPTDVSYPVPAVDAYRATFSNINVHDAGIFALTGPGWTQVPPRASPSPTCPTPSRSGSSAPAGSPTQTAKRRRPSRRADIG